MKYVVGKTWWFKEISRTAHAGETLELEESVAEKYMHNEPDILKPDRVTTQRMVSVKRSDKPTKRLTRSKK
jgi:hypothetical protein